MRLLIVIGFHHYSSRRIRDLSKCRKMKEKFWRMQLKPYIQINFFFWSFTFPLCLHPLKNNSVALYPHSPLISVPFLGANMGLEIVFIIFIFITRNIFCNKQRKSKPKIKYFLFGIRVNRWKVITKRLDFYLDFGRYVVILIFFKVHPRIFG